MYKLACMGDAASISGYAALGLETFAFESAEVKKAGETLHRLAQNGYGVIYITEALAQGLAQEIARYNDKPLPAIILIPGVLGNTGNGLRNVFKSVERAVGSNILQNQD